MALLTAAVAAQARADPQPWSGVQEEVTVTLQWDFDSGAGSLLPQTPDFQVAALSAPCQPHELLEIDTNTFSVVNSVPLLTLPTVSPIGPMDMAVEARFPQVGPPQEWVFTLMRTAAGDLAIDAVDVQSGAADPARSLLIPAANGPFAPNQRLGLAFDPDGDGSLGSFWITGLTVFPPNSWRAFEFPATGATSQPLDDIGVPPDTVGLTYDETLGNFYALSRTFVQSARGSTSRVNGAEISAYNFQQTGVRFSGDLTIPDPQGPAGGVASAISMYRTFGGNSSEARFVCVANVGSDQFYYELAGPYRYGYCRYGRLGMENGPPFVGGTFDITLSGVPNSLLAAVFLGGSANNLPIGVEAYVSANSFSNIGPLLPTSPGKFRIPINVPPNPSLAYFELFAQCVVLDGTAPGFLGYTQTGKTVIYP